MSTERKKRRTGLKTQEHGSEENRMLVQNLVACGHDHRKISEYMGVSTRTLQKYYKAELQKGATEANMLVANSLFAKATDPALVGPAVTAAIFWLKCRAGWKEAATSQGDSIADKEEQISKIEWEVVDVPTEPTLKVVK
jgi:hypothetical protein